jgi:hypothetical protein
MRGSSAVARALSALGALLLLFGTLPGCSRTDPAPKDVTLATQRPARDDAAAKLEAARAACTEETKRKGIASVVGILWRLRPGASNEDFVACMKARGYEVPS